MPSPVTQIWIAPISGPVGPSREDRFWPKQITVKPSTALDSAVSARAIHGPARVAVVVLFVGLLFTLAAAGFAQRAAETERAHTFGRAAEAVQQTLTARVEELASRFASTLSFIGSTHPLPAEVYNDYFQREIELHTEVDPGVILIEEVPREELDDLEARERALGNEDFAVTTFDAFPTDTPALVVTRASKEANGTTFPFLGYDVLPGRELLIPDSFPEGGYVLRVTESALLLSASIQTDNAGELVGGEEIPEVSPFFVGQAVDGDGNLIGWVVRFLDAQRVSERIGVPEHINVRLFVAGLEEPIATVPQEPATSPRPQGLYEQREVTTASLSWSMEVWADADFGESAGLFDQRRVWASGLPISAALALAAGAWAYYRRRLAGASFELEHARTLATTDHLTGLLNRHGLIDAARVPSANEKATLYFVDMDGFKAVNDARGHEAGDAVLVAVATALRKSFRHDDLVSRLGGDEFVVFTVGERAEANVQAIAQRVVDRIGKIDPQLSCSLGIAHRPPGDGSDVKDLLRYADKAMYRAKRNGGDRYAVASS